MQPPRITRLAIVAVALTFFGTLIAAFPARVAIGWFAPAGVAVSGVNGSVWSGRAQALRAPGLSAGPVSWRIRPLSLLIGRLVADIEATVPGGFASGRISASMTGAVHVRDARASVPLAQLTAGMSIGRAAGMLQANVDRLRLVDGWPESIVGELRLQAVRYPVPQLGNTDLGSYSVTFPPVSGDDAGMPEGIIKSLSGPYDVTGTLRLASDRGYSLTADVRATPSAAAPLRNALQFLGRPNDDGYYTFRSDGTL